jgi:hypothetical protein
VYTIGPRTYRARTNRDISWGNYGRIYMTLMTCYECSKPVSDKATACPHCGAPAKVPSSALLDVPPTPAPTQKRQVSRSIRIAIYAAVIVMSIPLMVLFEPAKKDVSPAGGATIDGDCANDDIQCFGNKGIVAAGVYCAPEVERHAKHSVKWTDGTFETKFSRFRWRNVPRRQITYIGDKAEFQNGFGAFTPVVYECDLDADRKTVLDVRVREGRLR